MKKLFLSVMLFCGLAIMGTSCNDKPDDPNNPSNVTPETTSGSIVLGEKVHDITTSNAVTSGQKQAIVLASKAMTEADNQGIAVIFDGDITPGTYKLGENKAGMPQVVGLKEFNMGELPFIISGADSLYFGDIYFWVSGELSVVENNGTYTVILSQCAATNEGGTDIHLAVNFNGTLVPYVFDANNKFFFNGRESAISLATLASLTGFDLGVRSMMFMSADRQRFFIVSFLGDEPVDGEYQLGYLGTPYLPIFPCVHVALDADFWTFQPQTGYIAQSGTMKIATNPDGTKTITIENGRFKNVEHDNEFFFPVVDGSLYYHGLMFEAGIEGQ